MKSKITTIIIIVVALVLFAGYYFFVYKKGADSTPLIQSSNSTSVPMASSVETPGLGKEFLTFLLNVRNIKLDDSVFSDSSFGLLKDSSIELVQDGTEGRINPFAPIGSENTPAPLPLNQNSSNKLIQP